MSNKFTMLCYRYWLESKTRFLIALILLIAVILYAISGAEDTISQHGATHDGRQINFTQYVWVIIYKGYFLTIFTLSAFTFGLGGPVQEKQNGNALFALSLPVYRYILIRSKITVASLQVVFLAIIAAVSLPLIGLLYGYIYPLKDTLLFSFLMSSGGLLFMMLSVHLSFFISRQMLVMPLGIAIMATLFFVTKLPALRTINIFNFMTGAGYLSNDNFLFSRNINLPGIFILLLITITGCLVIEQLFKKVDI